MNMLFTPKRWNCMPFSFIPSFFRILGQRPPTKGRTFRHVRSLVSPNACASCVIMCFRTPLVLVSKDKSRLFQEDTHLSTAPPVLHR
mmetsp:Transcript_32352/g.83912  ORF Transcript_32352/g.83912 Transcript_32352/m.83912 type:complete len:87 (+) Transcript_32352:222-482(+)